MKKLGQYVEIGKNLGSRRGDYFADQKKYEEECYKKNVQIVEQLNILFPGYEFKIDSYSIVAQHFPIKDFTLLFSGNLELEVPMYKPYLRKYILTSLKATFPEYRFYLNANNIKMYLQAKRVINGREDDDKIMLLKETVKLIQDYE
ncbi:hypothetical protein [Plebeiibacterium marinum]|uniref:Uncharacterized protein n=1 Tax=Plebeiibacterium marinum TaxID=2992111 RepID=A0AAE3MHL3_9BACT|nr:hypothetical protein [Plebeiobacterium marinum]MCW3807771.1 hypothetical protein [Plebeiobacterium marinum]